MGYRSTLQRIRRTVSESNYHVPTDHLRPQEAEALSWLSGSANDESFDARAARDRVDYLHVSGAIGDVLRLSALCVIAASPSVRDYREAHRLASQQEFAALEEGGPRLDERLAAVERHRGVVAYMMGQYEPALQAFTRALERERSAENLGNVLAALLKLGELEEAADILTAVRERFPPQIRDRVFSMVARDPDLASLRPTSGQPTA